MQAHASNSFSHVAVTLEALAEGRRFLLAARPDLDSVAWRRRGLPHAELVPCPAMLVADMQRVHRSCHQAAHLEVDTAETSAIQRQLTWNRVIATVSGPLDAAYRGRVFAPSALFMRLNEPRHQTYYFAHRTEVLGHPIEGYWASRDLREGHPRPWWRLEPVEARAVLRPSQVHSAALATFSVPILDTWSASVRAGSRRVWDSPHPAVVSCPDTLPSVESSGETAEQHYHRLAAAWEPIMVLVLDALTGAAGKGYEWASTQAAFSQVGLRHITLALDARGEVSARVIPSRSIADA